MSVMQRPPFPGMPSATAGAGAPPAAQPSSGMQFQNGRMTFNGMPVGGGGRSFTMPNGSTIPAPGAAGAGMGSASPMGPTGQYPALGQLLSSRSASTPPGSAPNPTSGVSSPPGMPPASAMASGAPPFSGSMPSSPSPAANPAAMPPNGNFINSPYQGSMAQYLSHPDMMRYMNPDTSYAAYHPGSQLTARQQQNQADQQASMQDFSQRISRGENTALPAAGPTPGGNAGQAQASLQFGGINGQRPPASPPAGPATPPVGMATMQPFNGTGFHNGNLYQNGTQIGGQRMINGRMMLTPGASGGTPALGALLARRSQPPGGAQQPYSASNPAGFRI